MLNRIGDKMQLWSSFCSELLEVAINSDGRRVLIVQRLDEIDKVMRNSHVLKHSIEISIWQSRKLWCNRNTEIWYVKFSCFLNDLSQVQYLNSLVPLPGTNPHCSSAISINRKCLSLSLRRILLACVEISVTVVETIHWRVFLVYGYEESHHLFGQIPDHQYCCIRKIEILSSFITLTVFRNVVGIRRPLVPKIVFSTSDCRISGSSVLWSEW